MKVAHLFPNVVSNEQILLDLRVGDKRIRSKLKCLAKLNTSREVLKGILGVGRCYE